MEFKILEKSSMIFELPDGKGSFILTDIDIKQIADKLSAQVLINNPEKIVMLQDTGLARAKQLYAVYQKEKADMTEELRQNCLVTIVKFLSENDYELTTLKEQLDKDKKL